MIKDTLLYALCKKMLIKWKMTNGDEKMLKTWLFVHIQHISWQFHMQMKIGRACLQIVKLCYLLCLFTLFNMSEQPDTKTTFCNFVALLLFTALLRLEPHLMALMMSLVAIYFFLNLWWYRISQSIHILFAKYGIKQSKTKQKQHKE